MKAGTIIMKESNQKRNLNTASKNVGSFVKIDSISIDLEDVSNKSYVEKCEHFSIRGYVAEVRTKNWQLCWPFSLGDEQNKSEEQKSLLPPLDAPKFRWWSCQSCLQEVGSRVTAKDCGTEFNSCIGSKASSTCSQMPSLCDSVMPFPDAQQTPKPTEVVKRQSDVHTSTDANGNIHQLSLCSDKKEVSASEAYTTIIGPSNGSENEAVHEISRLTFIPPEINSNVLQENPKHYTDTEAQNLAGSKPMDLCKNSCGNHHEVPDAQPATNMGMCESSSKICQIEKPNSLDEQLKELKIASGASGLACLNEEAGNAIKGQTNGYGSQLSNECDNASSDSVKILVGNNPQDQNHPLSSGSQRRKTRKVRLLTELLFQNGDAKTDLVSAENSPNAIINDASAEVGMVDVPKDQVSLPENCGEDLADIKKSKMPEEGRSPETSSLNNRSKKCNNFKGSEEVVNEIGVSELEQDASAGLYLQNSRKSFLSKYGNDNIPVTGKKKKKKNQTADAPSSLVPIAESLPGQILGQVGSPSKVNVHDGTSFRLRKDASTSRRLDKNPLAASRKEKKSSLFKKKSKITPVDNGRRSDLPFFSWPKAILEEETPVDDGQTSEFPFFSLQKTSPKEKRPQFPWNSGFQEKDTPMRNEEIMQTGPPKVSLSQAEDAPVDTGLHLSLGSFVPTKQYGDNEIPGTNVDANHKCHSSISPKPASYAFSNTRVHGEFSRILDGNNMPIQSRKQMNNSQVEEGCYPPVKQVDISGAKNCDQAIKVKEHSSVSRKHADRIAANVSDPGACDDIPMEIVELMARNQYERRLESAENNKRLLKIANDGRSNQTMDYDRVCDSGELRINEEPSQRRNPQARNGKNGINLARKGVESAKQMAVDYISNIKADNFDINHLGQKKSSTGVQIPVHSSKCSCAQNCSWNRDMVGHEFLNAGMQIEPCEKCPMVSQPREEAAYLWPSTLPLHMPPGYNIPQTVASQPTNLDYLRKHDPRFLNLNVIGHEKHNQNSGSENFSRRNAEYPIAKKNNGIETQQNLMGSLDLYSNETIPAMHLLSLMDAGMQSGPSFNAGGNSKFLKSVSPVDHNSEYSRLEFGVYGKRGDTMKHPVGVYSKPSDTMNHPLDYFPKNKLPEKSHYFFPLNPTVGPSTSSFHHDKRFERANDFMGLASSSSRRKEKVQSSGLQAQNRGRKPLNSMFASGGLGTNHSVIPVHGLQKGSLGASASMVLPLQLHTAENSTEFRLENPHSNGTFWPPKVSPESTICSINRNPADFTMPKAGNEYMIRGEDLKFRKLRKRPCLVGVDQRKRKRNAKRAAEEAYALHQIS